MSIELLRKAIPQPLVNRLWQRARAGRYPAGRSCPTCNRGMVEAPIAPATDETLHLDVCTGCRFVWFDPREFEALPKLAVKPAQRETLPPQAREALALAQLEALTEQSKLSGAQDGPDHGWEFAVALRGIPIEYNDAPLKNRPIVTWLLATMIAGVSLAAFHDLPAAVNEWGLIPAEFARHFGLTFITSFFLHAGLVHLIGNLYFLIVFGDNTEDILGKRRYLLLVAAATIVGDLAHILFDPRMSVPCVGASGGISGIMAYYCLRFPSASIGIVWWFRWFRVPVGIMFAMWILTQVMDACWILPGIGGVAVFAHLGGAGGGALFWWLTRPGLAGDERVETSVPLKQSQD